MVVLDAATLMLFLRPDVGVPTDRSGNPVAHARERIEYLIDTLEKQGTKIVVPTPALSEMLVRAGPAASQAIVEELNKQAVFRIEPFDQRAAIEVAAMLRDELPAGKKAVKGDATWAKVKFDRQIVAIAKVTGATMIYSDDDGVNRVATRAAIPVQRVAELPIPPAAMQHNLPFDGERA